jgi:hypothetical protein
MNAKGAAILVNPHPRGHVVYPYTDESLVSQAVCLYASAGLRNGEGVILIMTRAHFDPILRRMEGESFDLRTLQNQGQLVCIAAEDLLPQLMAGDMPDEKSFKAIVGGLIGNASAAGSAAKVRVFGEMVSLLWNTNLPAALRLEELWNETIETHSIALMCTYDLGVTPLDRFPQTLNAVHTHNLAPVT